MEKFEDINDVTVHIDPEDDEAAASCMNLPVRSEILATLNKAWSEHAILKNIDDVTLHYLDGHIYVEACLPLTHLQRLEDADDLKNEFSQICSSIESLGESKLNFC